MEKFGAEKNVSFDDMANRQNTSSKKNGVLVFMQKCISALDYAFLVRKSLGSVFSHTNSPLYEKYY